MNLNPLDAVSAVAEKARDAVTAVAAPLVSAAGEVVSRPWNTIVDVWHGYFGSPNTTPTNWNGFSHQDMYEMVHADASPGQVGEQSFTVDVMARSAQEATDEVGREHQRLFPSYSGEAANRVLDLMGRHEAGGAEAAGFITSVSRAMDEAAAALSEAQRTMPKPVPVESISQIGGTIGGSLASAAAPLMRGPAGAIGNFVGAGVSGFGANVVSAQRTAEAVAVMQRYERRLQAAENMVVMPSMLPPGGTTPPPPPPPPPGRTGLSNASASRRSTPAASATSVAGSPVHAENPRSSADPARPGVPGPVSSGSGSPGPGSPGPVSPGPGTGSGVRESPFSRPSNATFAATAAVAPTAVPPAAGGFGALPGPGGGGGVGPDGRLIGGPAPWRDLVGRGSGPGLLPPGVSGTGRGAGASQSAARAGMAGGRGSPVMSGVPGAAARPQGEEDAEHRNKMPHDDALFSCDDLEVPPPVIGA